LKIDKTFVDEITNNPIDQILVKAFIEVCKKLSVKVVCEGVEREDQLETIKNLGCHEYQGYLLSKPQCVEEIEKFINSQKIIN
jgi:EAL domain-containing protein (putative c-di-GMP-specific phosphodiesterase class I)